MIGGWSFKLHWHYLGLALLIAGAYILRSSADSLGGFRAAAEFLGEGGLTLGTVAFLAVSVYGLVKQDLYSALLWSVLFVFFVATVFFGLRLFWF